MKILYNNKKALDYMFSMIPVKTPVLLSVFDGYSSY